MCLQLPVSHSDSMELDKAAESSTVKNTSSFKCKLMCSKQWYDDIRHTPYTVSCRAFQRRQFPLHKCILCICFIGNEQHKATLPTVYYTISTQVWSESSRAFPVWSKAQLYWLAGQTGFLMNSGMILFPNLFSPVSSSSYQHRRCQQCLRSEGPAE